jgi:hypothetical protein
MFSGTLSAQLNLHLVQLCGFKDLAAQTTSPHRKKTYIRKRKSDSTKWKKSIRKHLRNVEKEYFSPTAKKQIAARSLKPPIVSSVCCELIFRIFAVSSTVLLREFCNWVRPAIAGLIQAS